MYESDKPKRKRKALASKETQILIILGLVMLMVMLTGIGFLAGIVYSNSRRQASLISETPFSSVQETATALATYLAPHSDGAALTNMCMWAWARQPNPELSAEIQQRLIQRLPQNITVEVMAESFGETCERADGSSGFGAMETDFYVTVSIENLPTNDAKTARQMIAPVLREILLVLHDYPPDTTPGPMAGLIDIEFSGQETVGRVRSGYNFAIEALRQGLTGENLVDALGGLRS